MKSLSIVAALAIAWLSLDSPALAQARGAEPAEPAARDVASAAEAGSPAADAGTSAADTATDAESQKHYLSFLGVAFALGLIIAGAAYGIARIAACSVDSMARQPEVAGNIQMVLIITASMIEGIAFFALIICLLEVFS